MTGERELGEDQRILGRRKAKLQGHGATPLGATAYLNSGSPWMTASLTLLWRTMYGATCGTCSPDWSTVGTTVPTR